MKIETLRVEMPDGSVWDIPARVVAEHRADYYAKKEGEHVRDEEIDFALSDRYELVDWARNNMNWSDVCSMTALVKEPTEAYDEWWSNSSMEAR